MGRGAGDLKWAAHEYQVAIWGVGWMCGGVDGVVVAVMWCRCVARWLHPGVISWRRLTRLSGLVVMGGAELTAWGPSTACSLPVAAPAPVIWPHAWLVGKHRGSRCHVPTPLLLLLPLPSQGEVGRLRSSYLGTVVGGCAHRPLPAVIAAADLLLLLYCCCCCCRARWAACGAATWMLWTGWGRRWTRAR